MVGMGNKGGQQSRMENGYAGGNVGTTNGNGMVMGGGWEYGRSGRWHVGPGAGQNYVCVVVKCQVAICVE